MKIDFSSERKLYWIVNFVLYNILRPTALFRNKKLWVFGAQTGMKYDDNSMYLFEYVNQTDSNIRTVWLTRTDEVVSIVRKKGYEAYNVNSLKGKKISLKAGVAFYTNGLDDFGCFPFIGGARIVSLWHGVGFKKIYNETYEGIWLKLKQALDMLFSWTTRNISIATSDYSKQKTIRQFHLKEKDVQITGQPRNDVFKIKEISKKDVLSGVTIPEDKKILLYMPTYRWTTSQEHEIVSSIIQDLASNDVFNTLLRKKNLLFVAKLHFKTKIDEIKLNDNFIILRDENVISNQELLAVSDVLLTDYSSCFIDFALLCRPILFYTPDIEDYVRKTGGIENEFFTISHNRANNIKELCNFISDIDEPYILEQAKIVNDSFEDKSIAESCYCANVYKLVLDRLK